MKRIFTLLSYTYYKSISLVLVLFFISEMSTAQVKNTDVNPDVTKSLATDGDESYNVDLNGDDVPDFAVSINKTTNEPVDGQPNTTFTGYTVGIEGLQTGNDIVVPSSDDFNASSLNVGDVIDNSKSFTDVALLFISGTYTASGITSPAQSSGNFINSTGKYVGVKFVVGSNTYFGYIGINTGTNSFTIRDFAFEQTSSTAITITAVTSLIGYINSNVVTIKNIEDAIQVDFALPFMGKMEVVNINGQIVKSILIADVSSSFSTLGMPSGIYQIVVSGTEGFISKKVLITGR